MLCRCFYITLPTSDLYVYQLGVVPSELQNSPAPFSLVKPSILVTIAFTLTSISSKAPGNPIDWAALSPASVLTELQENISQYLKQDKESKDSSIPRIDSQGSNIIMFIVNFPDKEVRRSLASAVWRNLERNILHPSNR